MKVLHLAAGNRWTGAAAPAFAEVEALRQAGVDAHYVYVGGYKLEAKLGRHDFVHPLIDKAQNPMSFSRSMARIERLVAHHTFDIIHTHLSWDHWLARFLVRGSGIRLARTLHSRHVLRSDPLTRSLMRSTDLLFSVNATFGDAPVVRGRRVTFTPPPVDPLQFSPTGPDMREKYGLAPQTRLVTAIGKLSKGRGFEEALRTFSLLRPLAPETRMMIIGHGEHRPVLERFALTLGIANDVIWAGYHEEDLADHYRASDLLLFTARGSDEGHRAVLEAMACAVPVASFPIDGVEALIGREMTALSDTPEALAGLAKSLLARDSEPLRLAARERSREFSYESAARRLIEAYGLGQ